MSQPDDSDAFEIEPLPENLLREPLDFLFADHYRQRVFCDLVLRLAARPETPIGAVRAAQALDFLERDLPLHRQDEEQDLFPCLRKRCRPEDNIAGILEILTAEHEADEQAAATLAERLRLAAPQQDLPASRCALRAAAEQFAAMQQRHLIWENVVVLPIARRRLLPSDLAAMGHAMADRRNVPFPE